MEGMIYKQEVEEIGERNLKLVLATKTLSEMVVAMKVWVAELEELNKLP